MAKIITPVQNQEREVFMDVLRGFAILGILIANFTLGGFSGYSESAKLTGPFLLPDVDHPLTYLEYMFIDGKFYSIFSLLFGWGISLQIQRGINRGIDPIPTIKRRLMFMLLLGAFHLLIWPGDIVFFYALLGFVLLPFRKFTNKTLLITSACLILLPIILYAAKSHWQWLNAPAGILFDTGEKITQQLTGVSSEAEFHQWFKHGSWWGLLKSNIGGFFLRYGYLFFVSRIPKVLGVFLIGFIIGRSDFYKNIAQNRMVIYWIIGLGLLLGLPANYFLAYYATHFEADYFNLQINGLYQTIAYALGVVPLALAYVGIFILCFETTAGKKIMSVIAPVGKMAFSNYIMHSLVGNFVFFGAGLGYSGQVGPAYLLLFCICFFITQIIISTIWLKYFNYGPFEWVWRSLTYGKLQPMKR